MALPSWALVGRFQQRRLAANVKASFAQRIYLHWSVEHRRMDHQYIKVFDLKVVERFAQALLHSFGMHHRGRNFRENDDVFALDSRTRIVEGFMEHFS